MRCILRWLGVAVGAIVGLAVLAFLFVWFAGGRIVDRFYEVPESTFIANPSIANVQEGRRAALLRGCYKGCHGDGLEGAEFVDSVMFGKFSAPDLTIAFAEMSDSELDLVIRYGIRRDGKSTILMPSASFHHLSDDDFNNITAFIRNQPKTDGPSLEAYAGPMLRFLLWRRIFLPNAQNVRENAPWINDGATDQMLVKGEYLVRTICTECHGTDLTGFPDFTPPLVAAKAYSAEDFGLLMRKGIAVGGRELDLMGDMARRRFVNFTDEEVEAVHAYLITLADADG